MKYQLKQFFAITAWKRNNQEESIKELFINRQNGNKNDHKEKFPHALDWEDEHDLKSENDAFVFHCYHHDSILKRLFNKYGNGSLRHTHIA